MEIQSNIAPSSLFDSLAQKQGAGAKDDMFASMMDRLLSEAAARKREQAQAAADAEDQRKAPIRPDRPKPFRADRDAAPQRADVVEPPRAKDGLEKAPPKERPEPRSTEAPRKDSAPKADRVERDTRKDAPAEAPGAKATSTEDIVRKADETTDAPQDGETVVRADAQDAQQGDGQADGNTGNDETVIVEAELTITETTVEVITDEGSFALAMLEGEASLDLTTEAPDAESAAEAPTTQADATALQTDAAVTPQSDAVIDPAAQLAVQAAVQAAAQAAAQAPAQAQQAAEASGDQAAPKAAEALAPVTPVDPALATPAPGDLAADTLPSSDEEIALPGNLAELAAAKAKGGDKAGQKSDADTGGKGDGQNQGANPSLTQPQETRTQTAESVKAAAQDTLMAATATTEATVAKPAEASGVTSTNPAIAAMEAPRAAAGVEAPQATAHLRPSRGSAGMPHGVQEQVAVHIQKNVSDGNDQFTINLRPVELGRIDIRLEIAPDGRVSAMVAVEKAQTLELLQRDSRNLERALQDAGLKADSDSLNFSLRGEGGSPFQDEGQRGGSGRRGRGFAGGGEAEDAASAYTVTLAPGRVDIHA